MTFQVPGKFDFGQDFNYIVFNDLKSFLRILMVPFFPDRFRLFFVTALLSVRYRWAP